MAGLSALGARIARALARGQVKKATRLQIDDKIRRGFWRAQEERVFNPNKQASQDIVLATLKSAYDDLIAAGYPKDRAGAVLERFANKANRELIATWKHNTEQPLPKIRPGREPRESASFPTLQPNPGEAFNPPVVQRELNALYPDVPLNTLVSYKDQVYRKYSSDAMGGYWVQMKTRQGLPHRRRGAYGEWTPE